jgi:hypothetical protein
MHININLVWDVIITWSVLVIAALAFNYGAHRNKLREEA